MVQELTRSEFIADAAIAHLRAGCLPNEADAILLDRRPLIDNLRKRIGPSDAPWLISTLESASDALAGLASSLLRHQMDDPKVRTSFEQRWPSASPYLKNRIMWRLLDDRNLEPSWLGIFRRFVFDHWDVFQQFNRTFYGPPDKALGSLLSRITDTSLPESKKWIYLCCAPGVTDDIGIARAVIRLGLAFADPMSREVAEELLNGFPWEPTVWDRQAEKEEASDFVADAVMLRLRSGVLPNDLEGEHLNRLPIVELLRIRVREDDIPWILETIDRREGEIAGLFLSLLKAFAKCQSVQHELQRRWQTGDTFLRAHLLWRLLDSTDLDSSWHERIFTFVQAEWPTFREVSLKFLGTPQTVVEQMIERIGDPDYPDSKKWICLCRVADVAANRDAARGLLHLGLCLPDPFARRVADTLLQRFYPDATRHSARG